MKKLLAFIVLISFTTLAFSQMKYYDKAEKQFNEKNLKGALKYIDKCMENKETKNHPLVRLLKAKIMYGLSQDPDLKIKYPNALKDAIRFAEFNPENKLIMVGTKFIYLEPENVAFFKNIVKANNKEALEAYNTNKYAKALPVFKRSLSFGMDTQSLVLVGECYWQMNLKIESLPYFKEAAEMIYSSVTENGSKLYGYSKLPFRQLGRYYIDKKQYDTAYIIVKNGREILPNDPVLSEYTYNLMRYALEKIPPSEDYLRMVQQSLSDFPTDSFLNHRENSIYIYLLNGMAKSNEQKQFDSLILLYAKSKELKAKSKNLELIKKFDIFAGQGRLVFLEKIYKYFGDIGLREACYAAFNTYTSNLTQPNMLETFSYYVKEQKPYYAEMLFNRYIELNPKDGNGKQMQSTYLIQKNKEKASYYDLLPLTILNDVSSKDFPKDLSYRAKAKEYRTSLIKEAMDSNDFALSRRMWNESNTMYVDLRKTLELQWKDIVVADFKVNYYGTRINPAGKKEMGVPEYKWKGNVDQCLPGKMSDTLILRLENRINYFRRMAGVSEEIVLTNDNNENCEIAALMCEANKSMSHQPTDAWRCFIPAGFDALKLSILSRDGNPAIAVTAAMGQNHPTVGNRRWLLYPYSQLMGIGTASNYTSILTIDNSNKFDTLKYKSQYIAWPPAGYCPKMMVYKKWSFTINQNLAGATVLMKNKLGENMPLKIEALAPGYGLNTLVWEPEINMQTTEDNDEFTVVVTLANSKTFNYKVKIADIKL